MQNEPPQEIKIITRARGRRGKKNDSLSFQAVLNLNDTISTASGGMVGCEAFKNKLQQKPPADPTAACMARIYGHFHLFCTRVHLPCTAEKYLLVRALFQRHSDLCPVVLRLDLWYFYLQRRHLETTKPK